MGLFGVAEVIYSIRVNKPGMLNRKSITFRSMVPTRDDIRRSWYADAARNRHRLFLRRLARHRRRGRFVHRLCGREEIAKEPSRFGKGAIEGIMGPESANNAADQTAFIPTMTLGIPGNVMMALMIGALTIHGIVPGPQLMTKEPELFWGVLMSFWVGNLMLLFLSIPLIGVWIRLLMIPYALLYPAILLFVGIGVYSVSNSTVDVIMVVLLGGAGYIMRLLDFQPAPLILGFVLGPLMEENFRRTMLIARGDFLVFFERPISGTLMVLTIGMLLYALWSTMRPPRRQQRESEV